MMKQPINKMTEQVRHEQVAMSGKRSFPKGANKSITFCRQKSRKIMAQVLGMRQSSGPRVVILALVFS